MEVKVVTLEGCGWCESLVRELNRLNIQYEIIDAGVNSDFADSIEDLLQTTYYPIVILNSNTKSYYIYRPTHSYQLGNGDISDKLTKVGCATIEGMVSQVLKYRVKN